MIGRFSRLTGNWRSCRACRSLVRYHTTGVPVVRIGGVTAKVVYSGLAPGRKGAWQIDVLAPEDAPAGSAVPVEISYEGERLRPVEVPVVE